METNKKSGGPRPEDCTKEQLAAAFHCFDTIARVLREHRTSVALRALQA